VGPLFVQKESAAGLDEELLIASSLPTLERLIQVLQVESIAGLLILEILFLSFYFLSEYNYRNDAPAAFLFNCPYSTT
jgi:hypothetical protein